MRNKAGIVLAGDKRAIYEGSMHKYSDDQVKVVRVNKFVALAAAGDGNDASPIFRIVAKEAFDGDVDVVANKVSQLVFDFQKKFKEPEMSVRVQLGLAHEPRYAFIIAGFTADGDQRTYTVSHENIRPQEKDECWSEGMTNFAASLIAETYPKIRTLKQLSNLARDSIKLTSKLSYAVSCNSDVIELSYENMKCEVV